MLPAGEEDRTVCLLLPAMLPAGLLLSLSLSLPLLLLLLLSLPLAAPVPRVLLVMLPALEDGPPTP